MRKHISLILFLGALGFVAAAPATLRSATLQPPSGLCVQTLLGLECAPTPVETAAVKWYPGHYVLEDTDAVLNKSHFVGAKMRYFWRDLEPRKGEYDFSKIEQDLAELQEHGKRLFVNINYKAFNTQAQAKLCAPEYIWDLPGAIFKQDYKDVPREAAKGKTGLWRCMARIANPPVVERLAALGQALGERFNDAPYFAGVSLMETASTGGPGTEIDDYVRGLKRTWKAFADAFPNTLVFVQFNWLEGGDDGSMLALMQYAEAIGIGISGPDLMPTRPTHSSVHYPKFYGRVALGIENQRAPLVGVNPQAAWDFALNKLKVNYLFWAPQNNGIWDFENKIVPLVGSRNGAIHTECPEGMRCITN